MTASKRKEKKNTELRLFLAVWRCLRRRRRSNRTETSIDCKFSIWDSIRFGCATYEIKTSGLNPNFYWLIEANEHFRFWFSTTMSQSAAFLRFKRQVLSACCLFFSFLEIKLLCSALCSALVNDRTVFIRSQMCNVSLWTRKYRKKRGKNWSLSKYLFMCWSLVMPQNRYGNVRVAPSRSHSFSTSRRIWHDSEIVLFSIRLFETIGQTMGEKLKEQRARTNKWNHKLKWLLLFASWNADTLELNDRIAEIYWKLKTECVHQTAYPHLVAFR